jgi:hypothetical protein
MIRDSGKAEASRSSASAAAARSTTAEPDPVIVVSAPSKRADSSKILISGLISSTANAKSLGPK